MNGKNIFKKLGQTKKMKIGALAAAFTAFFVAVIVVLNGIVSVLANKFGWYVDMTSEAVFTLSDEAKGYLADLTADVNIYFAAEPDELMADFDMRYVYNTAKELEAEFSNIRVSCHDVIKHPDFFRPFYESTGTEITQKTVVFECGSESIITGYKTFFTYNEEGDRWAYSGDYRFVSCIMRVTQNETPIAYFTKVHSEDSSSGMEQILTDSGFEVRQINLRTEEIDDDARLIIINNPKNDFLGIEAESESGNEIKKLDDFLDGLGGLIVFEDPEYSARLTNLNEFLEEWGISFRNDCTVKDPSHSMSVDGYSIVTEYPSEDNLGSGVYDDLENFDSMPQTIIRKAMPIDILWSDRSTGSSWRYVYPMLLSHDSAELIDNHTNTVKEHGQYTLMTLSRESRVIDNDHYYSYVMAAGTSNFANDKYLINSNAYGNSDILRQSMKYIGRNGILADIPLRPFDDTTSTATTLQARNYTVCVTLILPVIITVCGVVMIVRRRHS